MFTAPAPLRAGPIDLSVLVQDAETGRPITDLPIEVHAQRIGHAEAAIHAAATTGSGHQQASPRGDARAPRTRPMAFRRVGARHRPASQPIGFDVDVAEPAPPWLQLSLWIAWPLLPIGLFAFNQFRMRRGSDPRSIGVTLPTAEGPTRMSRAPRRHLARVKTDGTGALTLTYACTTDCHIAGMPPGCSPSSYKICARPTRSESRGPIASTSLLVYGKRCRT